MAVTQSTFNVIKMGAAADAITGLIDVNFLYWHSKAAAADDDLVVVILWEIFSGWILRMEHDIRTFVRLNRESTGLP